MNCNEKYVRKWKDKKLPLIIYCEEKSEHKGYHRFKQYFGGNKFKELVWPQKCGIFR